MGDGRFSIDGKNYLPPNGGHGFLQRFGNWLSEPMPGPTSDVGAPNQANYALPGGDVRGPSLALQAGIYDSRSAPQATGAQAGDSLFRGDQQALVERLRRQMSGEDSLSNLQLQRATNANIAQQRSLAASANPQNAAMMARLAAQNIGRMNQGYGQQAAMLGIQERNAAANALGAVAQGARAQDLGLSQFNAGQRQQNNQFNVGANLQQTGLNDQAAGNARNQELSNAELQQRGGMGYEQNQTQRYGIDKGVPVQPANWERLVGAASALAPAVKMMSDERAKTNISTPNGDQLDSLMTMLRPREFEYRDQRLGAGPRIGVMAQDVERGGPAGQAMVQEQAGAKMLDVPKSLGTALGLIGRLSERIDQMEGRAGGSGAVAARTKQTARPPRTSATEASDLYARPEELTRARFVPKPRAEGPLPPRQGEGPPEAEPQPPEEWDTNNPNDPVWLSYQRAWQRWRERNAGR